MEGARCWFWRARVCARERARVPLKKKGGGDEEGFLPPRFPFGTFPFLPRVLVPCLYPPSLSPHLLFILAALFLPWCLADPFNRVSFAVEDGDTRDELAAALLQRQFFDQHWEIQHQLVFLGDVLPFRHGIQPRSPSQNEQENSSANQGRRAFPPQHTHTSPPPKSFPQMFLWLTPIIGFCMYFETLHLKLCMG